LSTLVNVVIILNLVGNPICINGPVIRLQLSMVPSGAGAHTAYTCVISEHRCFPKRDKYSYNAFQTRDRRNNSECDSAVNSSLHGIQGCHLVLFRFLIPKMPKNTKIFIWLRRRNMMSPVIYAGTLTIFAGALSPWAPPWWRGLLLTQGIHSPLWYRTKIFRWVQYPWTESSSRLKKLTDYSLMPQNLAMWKYPTLPHSVDQNKTIIRIQTVAACLHEGSGSGEQTLDDGMFTYNGEPLRGTIDSEQWYQLLQYADSYHRQLHTNTHTHSTSWQQQQKQCH